MLFAQRGRGGESRILNNTSVTLVTGSKTVCPDFADYRSPGLSMINNGINIKNRCT